MKFRILLLTLLLLLYSPFTVLAHATEPRLEINLDRIIPGGVIDVRGVGFDYETVVTLTLMGAQSELSFGEVIADTEGIFLHIVTLPSDLPEGTYYFRGISPHHYTLSPALTVQGIAILPEGEGEEERWEEEEYLPYAIPTYPPGVVPGAVPGGTESVAVEASSEISPGLNGNIWILAGLLVLVSLLFIGFMKRKA